jgi:CheY-like chemotaxis protein
LAGTRVLLADDNQAPTNVTAALLQAHGARVECMDQRCGRAASSDIVMPGVLDGLEMARQLRREHPALPVVLISGFSLAEATREFVVLRKPCPEREMLSALADALRSPQGVSQV